MRRPIAFGAAAPQGRIERLLPEVGAGTLAMDTGAVIPADGGLRRDRF